MHKKNPAVYFGVLLMVSLSLMTGNAVAQSSFSDFEQALRNAGWTVWRDADGSLILVPGNQNTADETAPNQDSASDDATPDQWQQLQNALQATGWKVEREADGSLLLIPPGLMPIAPAAPATAPAISESVPADIVTTDSMQDFRQKLEQAGWFVTTAPDGSLLLYPPGMFGQPETTMPVPAIPAFVPQVPVMQPPVMPATVPQTPVMQSPVIPAPAAQGPVPQAPVVPAKAEAAAESQSVTTEPASSQPASGRQAPAAGSLPRIDIALPVNSQQEAYDIASSWLDSQQDSGATVGRIRKILRVYVVSIVTEETPHNLLQQIAIRASDGAVIVLN